MWKIVWKIAVGAEREGESGHGETNRPSVQAELQLSVRVYRCE